MLLVANKVDLVHMRKISEEQGKEMAARLRVCIILENRNGMNYL